MQDRERGFGAFPIGVVGRTREQWAGECCCAGQQLVPVPGGRGGKCGLKQLARDAEGEVALELARAGGQDVELRRERPRLGKQARLADPGRAFDHHKAAVAALGRLDRGVQRFQLPFALEQRPCRRSRLGS